MQVKIFKQVKETIDISMFRIIFPFNRSVVHHPDGSFTTREEWQQLDIDFETGLVRNWKGGDRSFYEDVDMSGIYQLYSRDGIDPLVEIKNEWPPQLIGDRGCLILEIKDNKIEHWHKWCSYSLAEFLEYFGITTAM